MNDIGDKASGSNDKEFKEVAERIVEVVVDRHVESPSDLRNDSNYHETAEYAVAAAQELRAGTYGTLSSKVNGDIDYFEKKIKPWL